MINKETILSVYTEKQTLLEYLTAIEKALNKAVLVSADIVDEGSNKCHFVFTFEDDTKIITPTIEFIKPVKGATIRNGVLYLTLADGTEVSAGSITASFGASTFNGDVLVKGNFKQTGGDAEVDGNCSINGILTQRTFELDIDLSVKYLPNNLKCHYAHARISNGKLNVVVALWAESGVTIPANQHYFASIPLSDSILAKLYPFKDPFLDIKTILGGCTPVVSTNPMQMLIYKETSGVAMDIANPEITTTSPTSWRFEFNFILK